MSNENLKNKVERLLKSNEEYEKFELEYILVDKNDPKEVFAIATNNDEILEIKPNTKEINNYMEWAFNYDEDFFEELEENKDIAFISNTGHYNLWYSIEDWIIDESENKVGIQKYLEYCKVNGITKEKLQKENMGKPELPDVMKYYIELDRGEEIIYKDFKAVVDEDNIDELSESLIEIYKLDDNEIIEIVSLKKQDLENNIKEYIEENFYINENNRDTIKMPKKMYDKEREQDYYNFILGYDLLQEMFAKSNTPECDTNYDFCKYVSSQYMKSSEYLYSRNSAYDNLSKWVNENKYYIQYLYNDYTGKECEIYNDMKVLSDININNKAIAVIERNSSDKKDYVLAKGYRIENNKLLCENNYYYNNIERVFQDYGNVIAKENEEKAKKRKYIERGR